MAAKRFKAQEFAIIAQRFSSTTFEEIDVIRWFNALRSSGAERKQSGEAPADARYHVATHALRWFTRRFRTTSPAAYCHLSRDCVFTSLRVPAALYDAAKVIAERDDVKLARVIETALRLYSAEVLTDKLRAFYSRAQAEGSDLIETALKRVDRR
jgi:hypothetical protein